MCPWPTRTVVRAPGQQEHLHRYPMAIASAQLCDITTSPQSVYVPLLQQRYLLFSNQAAFYWHGSGTFGHRLPACPEASTCLYMGVRKFDHKVRGI